jgi:cyclic beta-1,2-glucan synthetase
MGFFLVAAIDAFLPYIRERGDARREQRYSDHGVLLAGALNEAGWDGEWYRRGYYDDGSPLGSKESDECRIDALAQAWSVISRVAPAERARSALDAVERELISEEDRLIRLLAPPFVDTARDPGYIKGYVAGVRENGGQYTHAALWVIDAMAKLGRRDRAARLLEMIQPILLSGGAPRDARWSVDSPRDAGVQRYQLEPYVVAADVYGAEPHVGRGGWSWYTGSSGWMYRVAIESVLGFTIIEGKSIRVRPVIPDEWAGFILRYQPPGRATTYRISVRNPESCSETVVAVECATLSARIEESVAVIELSDDGNAHEILIDLGRSRA